jgi:hypothetical protein
MQRISRWKLFGSALVAIVGGGLAIHWWVERQGVGYLFNLESVPWSVSSADCENLGLTDTLATCSFKIAPEDFQQLLTSKDEPYSMLEAPHWKRAHDFPMSANLGTNFSVAYHYSAKPEDAPHGGSIDVLADASKRHVLAHLYIE